MLGQDDNSCLEHLEPYKLCDFLTLEEDLNFLSQNQHLGLRNLDLLLGLENRIIYTAQDVLDKNCRLDQALVRHKKEPNLALLPAGDPRMLDWMKPEDMKKISELLSELSLIHI